jgi:2-polyprenyl-3-methyl-5-hydroxy-6-metoxy-1,4-benzoquinol methylase
MFELVDQCISCHSRDLSELYGSVPGVDHEGTFTLMQCNCCSLVITSPIPVADTLSELYIDRTSADFPKPNPIVQFLRKYSATTLIRKSKIKKQNIEDRESLKMLDFGCGDAVASIEISRRLNAQLTCVDFHSTRPPALTDHREVEYFIQQSSGWKSQGPFDVILCRHVLEHSLDPASLLVELCEILALGGHILLEVPNFDCVWRKLLRKYWWAIYAPRHTVHFSKQSIEPIIHRAEVLELIGLSMGSTPIIGGSLGLLFRTRTSNLSLLGLLLYPLQFLIENIFYSKSTLLITLRRVS